MADEQNTEQDVQNPRTPEEQQALDNEMWDAVMELNRLHRPVNFYQDAANYRPAEMAGTEEEIETQRIRLFDVLAKGADINAQKAFDDE